MCICRDAQHMCVYMHRMVFTPLNFMCLTWRLVTLVYQLVSLLEKEQHPQRVLCLPPAMGVWLWKG